MDVQKPEGSSGAHGFSLVGLLMVIVVLGALTATAVVGVSSLTGSTANIGTGTTGTTAGTGGTGGTGGRSIAGIAGSINSSAASSCKTSGDAAKSASALYFVTSGGSYPVKWSDLTTSNPPMFELARNVVINGGNPRELDGSGWKLIVSGGGVSAPIFTCR